MLCNTAYWSSLLILCIIMIKYDSCSLLSMNKSDQVPSLNVYELLRSSNIQIETCLSSAISHSPYRPRYKRAGKSRVIRNSAQICNLLLWNIEGFHGACRLSPDKDLFKNYNILVLTETFITSGLLDIPGFYTFQKHAHQPDLGRPIGGILIATTPDLDGKLVHSTDR